nr:serine hydrolase domain-containing protein [Glycomyces amatae]
MVSIDRVRADLREHLAGVVLRHGVAGASVAVAIGEETAEAVAGVVNVRTGVPVTVDAVFQIQSITKVWTATLVMQLVDEGLVGLDDPVVDHLPGFRTADAAASARITVRHLLTHTGGFEGDLWMATTRGDDALQRLVEDWVPRAAQYEEPGSRYSYCSAGMAVLGRLVEVKRGASFAAVLRARLADPLGVEEIAFDADGALGFNAAVGHVGGGGGKRPLPVWATMHESNPAAGNRLAMSARALCAFGRMHVGDGLGPEGARVLSAASARAMREAGPVLPGFGGSRAVGLGWEVVDGGAVVRHGGGAIGFESSLVLVPAHRMVVAVLVNDGGLAGVMRDLVEPWVEAAAGVVPGPAPVLLGRAESLAGVERYAGVYALGIERVAVSVVEGRVERSFTPLGESRSMMERAGLVPESFTEEIRRVSGDLFAAVGPDGAAGALMEFLDADGAGRARFLHTGRRSVPRVG